MARYSLYIEQNGIPSCVPLNDRGEIKKKVNIEDIDLITTSYENSEQLVTALWKNNCIKFIPKKEPFIGYNSQGEVQKKEIIYGNSFLRNCALEVRKRKQMGEKSKEIKLSINSDLLAEVRKIKAYMLNPISNKNMYSNPLIPYKIKQLMADYVNLSLKTDLSVEEVDDLKEMDSYILTTFRDYQKLRNFIVWEKRYKKKLERENSKLVDRASIEGQLKIVDYLAMENREETWKKGMEEYQKIYDENADIIKQMVDEKNARFEEKYNGLDEDADFYDDGYSIPDEKEENIVARKSKR